MNLPEKSPSLEATSKEQSILAISSWEAITKRSQQVVYFQTTDKSV